MVKRKTESDQHRSADPAEKSNKTENIIGCLIFFLVGGFLFIAYFPGFMAYRAQGRREIAFPYLEKIHSSLRAYSENHPLNLFPAEMPHYEASRQIAGAAGQTLPAEQSETKIERLDYETNNRKDYLLRVGIEGNDSHFFVLYPGAIMEVSEIDRIDDDLAMQAIKMLLNMDRALEENNVAGYMRHYSPNAAVKIRHTIYKRASSASKQKRLKNVSYDDLNIYFQSLADFYSEARPGRRKREDVLFDQDGRNWKLHSSYAEEGIHKGKPYRIEGRSMFVLSPFDPPRFVRSDHSYASIYLGL